MITIIWQSLKSSRPIRGKTIYVISNMYAKYQLHPPLLMVSEKKRVFFVVVFCCCFVVVFSG